MSIAQSHSGRRTGELVRLTGGAAGAVAASAIVSALPLLMADSLARERPGGEATLLAGVSAGMLLASIATPVGAILVARIGLRQTIIGVLLALISLLLLSAAGSVSNWQLALVWAIEIAIAGCISPMVVGPVLATTRFPQHCATASSLFLSCALAAPLVVLPPFAVLIEVVGRWSVIVIVVGLLMVALLGAFAFIPDRFHAVREGSRPRVWPLAPARDATFWLLAILTVVCGVTSTGLIGNHLISICRVEGLDALQGAGAVAATGIFTVLGGVAFGAAADRWSAIRLLAIYYVARAILLLWLPHSSFSFRELSEFAFLYGLDSAATMPGLVRVAMDRFGQQKIGAIMSFLAMMHHGAAAATTYAVAAAGPQHYAEAFMAGGVLCLIAALLLALRISWRPPHRG